MLGRSRPLGDLRNCAESGEIISPTKKKYQVSRRHGNGSKLRRHAFSLSFTDLSSGHILPDRINLEGFPPCLTKERWRKSRGLLIAWTNLSYRHYK
jgi:hypothetical protein